MADEMYPHYENIDEFIEECLTLAKVDEVYDCDGYTPAELLVLSIQPKYEEQIESLTAEIGELRKENKRLDDRLNSPEIHDFSDAVVREAAHQRERWGSEHDEGKSAIDWLWLVAFLATKATQAERYDDHEKYLHHIISAAAACCNWHASAAGTNA